MSGGACAKISANPCDDGVDCTTDTCDEVADTCGHDLVGECAMWEERCTPDCAAKLCGEDGCVGSCGTRGAGMGCASGTGEGLLPKFRRKFPFAPNLGEQRGGEVSLVVGEVERFRRWLG